MAQHRETYTTQPTYKEVDPKKTHQMHTRQEAGGVVGAATSPQNLTMINVATFAVNALVVGASQFGLLGKSQVTISAEYPTLITPSPPFFGIWGIIYQLELAFVIWQALPANKGNRAVTRGIGPYFAAANVLQAVWAVAFAQEATIISAALLTAITLCLSRASIGLAQFRNTGLKGSSSWVEFVLTHLTIGLHAGWTFVAAALNVNVALQAYHAGTRAQLWSSLASIAIAAAAAGLFSWRFKDTAFNAATIWALAGISLNPVYRRGVLGKHTSSDFAHVTTVLAGALVVLEGVSLFKRFNDKRKAF